MKRTRSLPVCLLAAIAAFAARPAQARCIVDGPGAQMLANISHAASLCDNFLVKEHDKFDAAMFNLRAVDPAQLGSPACDAEFKPYLGKAQAAYTADYKGFCETTAKAIQAHPGLRDLGLLK